MKNIIPAIPSTNAIVAAACALEVVKIATCCSSGLDNYMMRGPAPTDRGGLRTDSPLRGRAQRRARGAGGIPLAREGRKTHDAAAHKPGRYNGTRGTYTHTVSYERDPACPVCSPGVPLSVAPSATLAEVLDSLVARFPTRLAAPSASFGGRSLYMRGVFEEETRPNLGKAMAELMGGQASGLLTVFDKKSAAPLRVRLSLAEGGGS